MRLTLTAEIELPPDVHVYSPGVRGYKPIQLVLHASRAIELGPVVYPSPKSLYLEAIKEQVPVFEGKFRITQDVTVNASKTGDGIRALLSASKTVSITGELQYQACDKTVCYPPTSVPVKLGVAGSTARSEAISQGDSTQGILNGLNAHL